MAKMIYKIKPVKDKLLEKIYAQGMKDLEKFYEVNWNECPPNICVLNNRKEIDLWRGRKTEPWVVGWADGRTVYLLNRTKYSSESSHTYRPEVYPGLVVHELSHLFYGIFSKENSFPHWLCEGVAIYTSGQLNFKKPVKKFSSFMKFFNDARAEIYAESGFVVLLLVEKFGKAKLLKLIRATAGITKKTEFDKKFEEIYGFKMSYQAMNKLLKERGRL